MPVTQLNTRPKIDYRIPNSRLESIQPFKETVYVDKFVTHNGYKTSVILKKDLISIGCTDFTPEVMYYIVEQYEKNFNKEKKEVVLQ